MSADLIARIEAATGPDRELDVLVALTVDWRWPDWEPGEPTVALMVEGYGSTWLAERAESGMSVWRNLPRFTSSVDAALSLMPPGVRISNLSQHDHEILRERGEWLCILYRSGKLGDLRERTMFEWRCQHAATPALALTAASLKARLASNGGEG